MIKKGRFDLLQLLQAPWELFSELYQSVDRDFLTVSNRIRTDPESLRTFEALSIELFHCLVKSSYPNPSRLGIVKTKLRAKIREFASDKGFSFLCLALFKGLGEYLGTSKQYELRHAGPIRVDSLTITTAPPNVIYKNLPNPIKKRYGVGIPDFTDLFEHISVIKETSPSIEPLKKTGLLSQVDTYLGWRIREGLKIGVSPLLRKD